MPIQNDRTFIRHPASRLTIYSLYRRQIDFIIQMPPPDLAWKTGFFDIFSFKLHQRKGNNGCSQDAAENPSRILFKKSS